MAGRSGCAAALVIARRGQGRKEKLPADHRRYFHRPEDHGKKRGWKGVAKNINTVGGRNRNWFYHFGKKQVRANCPMHRKRKANKISSDREFFGASHNDSS